MSLVSCFFLSWNSNTFTSACFDRLRFERSGWNLYKQVWRFPISAKLMSDICRLKIQCLQSWIPNCCYRWNHLFLARLKLHDRWHVALPESPRISWTKKIIYWIYRHITSLKSYFTTWTISYHVLELWYILTFWLNSS